MKDFDRVYKHYDNFMKFFSLYKLKEIKKSLNLTGNEVIVDIGGGTGKLGQYLSDSCELIYILDESDKMLSKVKGSEKIIPIVGDALNTDFESSSIDVVILSDVFHHIENQIKLLNEIKRILKNDGKLLIMDFEKNHFKTKLLILFEYFLFRKLYFKTKNEMINILTKSFKVNKVIDKGYYFIIVGENRC